MEGGGRESTREREVSMKMAVQEGGTEQGRNSKLVRLLWSNIGVITQQITRRITRKPPTGRCRTIPVQPSELAAHGPPGPAPLHGKAENLIQGSTG